MEHFVWSLFTTLETKVTLAVLAFDEINHAFFNREFKALWTLDAILKRHWNNLLFDFIKIFKLILSIKNILVYLGCNNISTNWGFFKMLITFNLLNTHPTKVYTTARTNHLIASINFLDVQFTIRASFCTFLQIIKIHIFRSLIKLFYCFILEVICIPCIKGYF